MQENPKTTPSGGEGDIHDRLNELKAQLPGTGEVRDNIAGLTSAEEMVVRGYFKGLKEGEEGLEVSGLEDYDLSILERAKIFSVLKERLDSNSMMEIGLERVDAMSDEEFESAMEKKRGELKKIEVEILYVTEDEIKLKAMMYRFNDKGDLRGAGKEIIIKR